MLPEEFYGCRTWSLMLRKVQRLWLFENWVLGRIFGLKRNEAIGGWGKMQNEE
jgi:hypothetical protein